MLDCFRDHPMTISDTVMWVAVALPGDIQGHRNSKQAKLLFGEGVPAIHAESKNICRLSHNPKISLLGKML